MGLLLQTPGKLLLRLLLMLLSLLLLLLLLLLLVSMLIDRLRIQRAVDVLDRPRPAEGCRPAKVVAKVDELNEVSN